MGVPASLSNDAGDYVCNCLFYSMLYYVKEEIPVGLIHVPFIHEQGYESYPSIEYKKMYDAIVASIRALGQYLNK